MKITTLFPALGVKNYRVFWITQWIALIGFWLQLTTQQWLVYKMTDSAFLLGLLSACQFAPSLLFTLGTGLWIDHHNKRKILMGTQSLYMLQALLLGLLLLSGHETYGWFLFFAFFLGTIDAFDMPARMAFMPELVGKEALHSAVSLNSTNFNITRMVGPLLAAFLLNYLSYSDIFFLNAVSLIPILFAYAKMNVNTPVIQETNKKPLHEIREGIAEARKNPIIFGNLLAAGIVSSLILNMGTYGPLFADRVLHTGLDGFGSILFAAGAGSMASGILSATSSTHYYCSGSYLLSAIFWTIMRLFLWPFATISWTIPAAFHVRALLYTFVCYHWFSPRQCKLHGNLFRTCNQSLASQNLFKNKNTWEESWDFFLSVCIPGERTIWFISPARLSVRPSQCNA